MPCRIHWNRVICKELQGYIGWPTVARTADGELLVVFSGQREEHVCPYGQTEMVRSRDAGETWSAPVVINNTPLDDRDPGILVTRAGTIVVSWFTARHSLADIEEYRGFFADAQIEAWKRHARKVSEADRRRWLGAWTRRSTDGGATWEPAVDSIACAPHGPIQVQDGRLVYVGVAPGAGGSKRLLCADSPDEGRTWRELGEIPIPADAGVDDYHEPHSVETADGRLVSMWRYQPADRPNDWYLHQSESMDGGKTWSLTHPTPMWGHPPHLIALHDGALLVTYGYRRTPYGERACLSRDGSRSWEIAGEIVLRDDSPNADLGYPASVELAPGEVLTVYYQIDRHSGPHAEKPCLMGTRWSLVG